MNQLKSVQGEVNSLREDNIKLYQKIRYLQSYSYISKQRGSEVRTNVTLHIVCNSILLL